MSVIDFANETLFNPKSPACWWKHPIQAYRVVWGALTNLWLVIVGKLFNSNASECTVCGWQGYRFATFLSGDEVISNCICPVCGSFDRHRQLVLGIREELAADRGYTPHVIVGFSLSSAMRFVLEHEGLNRCFRTDIAISDDRFAPDFVTDLRQPALLPDSVDWVFCSHVLEHIKELQLCVDEILRILKPGGVAWIQVPLEPERAHSKRIELDPHRAHAHAWQFAPDFGMLLERSEWEVFERIAGEHISKGDQNRYGIDPLERFWLVRKKK